MNKKYQSLVVGALALLVLPFALQAIGLTLTSSTDVVIYVSLQYSVVL